MHNHCRRRKTGVTSLAIVTGSMPGAAWAFENAPDANAFGLLVVAVLVLAAGLGAWVSLRERRQAGPARKAPSSGRRAA